MDVRKLLFPAVYVLCLLLCGAGTASAQCQNQGCQRPDPSGNPNCYTCTDVGGVYCTLSGSCPQSCTEGTCSTNGGGGDPCAENPIADGCPNPCINNPSAPVCCGSQIICEGAGGGGGSGGGGDGSGTGITGRLKPVFPSLRHKLDLSSLMATARRTPASAGCQPAEMPKKLLFSL